MFAALHESGLGPEAAVRGSAAIRPESEVERTYHLPRSLHPDPGPGMNRECQGARCDNS